MSHKLRVIRPIICATLSFVLVLSIPGTLLPMGKVHAADYTFNINDELVNESYSADCTVEIIGSGSVTTNTITLNVSAGKTVTVILTGVNIDVHAIDYACAFRISGEGNAVVELHGDNILISDVAGLCKGISGRLTITGDGSLTAIGGNHGAGIGGESRLLGRDADNILITGGIITAAGGDQAAGIGGASEGNGSNISITGGTITATGGGDAAGIGGGASSVITNGYGTNITITGGTITATGGSAAAGIGGGAGGFASDITITGGTITATGGENAAGIGGGSCCYASDITITGGTVTATGGEGGAGIGGGASGFLIAGNCQNVTITGGTIKAFGGSGGAGIGGGAYCEDNATVLTGLNIRGSANIIAAGGSSFRSIGNGASIGGGGQNSGTYGVPGSDGTDVTIDMSGMYNTGSVICYPAGTTLSDINRGTAQPTSTITGSIPAPTVVYEPEPEPPVNDMQEVEDKISEAINLGGTRVVRIEGYPALSYHVLEMLQDNPDITLVSEFTYDGLEYRITIPGSKVKLDPSIKWYGPKYLFPMFFMYGTDTLPAVQAYLDKYEKPAS